MKILFITDLYPVNSDEKTTPRTLSDFVEGFENLGSTVDVIKPNFILNSFLRKKPYYKTASYGQIFNVNYFTPFLFDVKKKLNKELNYDIVVAHMPSGILFADKLGIPFVAGVHNSDLTVLTSPLYKFYFGKRLLKALRHATKIACRSYVIQEKLLKLYPEFESKTFVAPSGVDENIIIEKIKENYPLTKILTCGNYKKRKNIDKILKATKNFDDIKLTVIGSGTDKKNLKNLNDNAEFKGYQPHKNVIDEMKNNDIFILPSIGETFGMVYLEAMASGCIAVCTKSDGIEGIIQDGVNGFTTEPTVDGVISTIKKIKELPPENIQKIRENSLTTVKEYTKIACCDKYLQQICKNL